MRLLGHKSKKLLPAAIRYSISELELSGVAVIILRNTEFTVIIDHSALLYILNAKREPPTLRLKKLMEVLSDYFFKVKFLIGEDMTISDFLSRHPGHNIASQNEIIPISFQIRELLSNSDKWDNIIEALKDLDRLNIVVDIFCQAKEVPSTFKRVTRKTAQPG